MTSVGILRGLSECASERGTFTILALDHRQNLRRDLRPDDPASVSGSELTEFKRAVVRALGDEATGVLLDPLYGAAQCIADGSLPGSIGLVVALEETGYVGPTTDRRTVLIDGWNADRARRLGASAAKLLVYYHPDAASVAVQERLVADAVRSCHAVDLPLFLEPLTFSPVGGAKLAGEDRRWAVVETARRLGALGVDVLKVEFPYDSSVDDRERWQEACAELDAAVEVPWVLLSGGADPETFSAQAETAGRAGASGVAAGRAIWAEATKMAGVDRDDFLVSTARGRLSALREVVERSCRPWRAAAPQLSVPEPGEDWFRLPG